MINNALKTVRLGAKAIENPKSIGHISVSMGWIHLLGRILLIPLKLLAKFCLDVLRRIELKILLEELEGMDPQYVIPDEWYGYLAHQQGNTQVAHKVGRIQSGVHPFRESSEHCFGTA